MVVDLGRLSLKPPQQQQQSQQAEQEQQPQQPELRQSQQAEQTQQPQQQELRQSKQPLESQQPHEQQQQALAQATVQRFSYRVGLLAALIEETSLSPKRHRYPTPKDSTRKTGGEEEKDSSAVDSKATTSVGSTDQTEPSFSFATSSSGGTPTAADTSKVPRAGGNRCKRSLLRLHKYVTRAGALAVAGSASSAGDLSSMDATSCFRNVRRHGTPAFGPMRSCSSVSSLSSNISDASSLADTCDSSMSLGKTALLAIARLDHLVAARRALRRRSHILPQPLTASPSSTDVHANELTRIVGVPRPHSSLSAPLQLEVLSLGSRQLGEPGCTVTKLAILERRGRQGLGLPALALDTALLAPEPNEAERCQPLAKAEVAPAAKKPSLLQRRGLHLNLPPPALEGAPTAPSAHLVESPQPQDETLPASALSRTALIMPATTMHTVLILPVFAPQARPSHAEAPQCKQAMEIEVPAATTSVDHGGDCAYAMLEKIGSGSTSVVHCGRRLSDGLPVALKAWRHRGPEVSQAARKEFERLEALSHPNICLAFAFYIYREQPVMVMDLFDGRSLDEVVRASKPEGRLSEQAAQLLGVQLLHAVEYLHGKDLLHRDIKPDNVLVSADLSGLRLVDFNSAAAIAEALTPAGSPLYAAPEVVQGEASSSASDVWSAALCLFFMLSGLLPQGRKDGMSRRALERAAGREVTFTAPVWEHVSSSCTDLLRRCLREDPSERPSMAEIMSDPWCLGSVPTLAETKEDCAICEHPKPSSSLMFEVFLSGL